MFGLIDAEVWELAIAGAKVTVFRVNGSMNAFGFTDAGLSVLVPANTDEPNVVVRQ